MPHPDYSMGFRSSATLNGASVLALISSTVTPSAISMSVSPWEKSTSKTPCYYVSLSLSRFDIQKKKRRKKKKKGKPQGR